MSMREAAQQWLDSGCSIIPIRTDGTKKTTLTSWARFQKEQPNSAHLDLWWNASPNLGIGVICGSVSGDLEMLELEGRAASDEVFDQIREACDRRGVAELWDMLLFQYGYAEWTPSGGLHLLYRIADHEVPGNTKVAQRPANEQEKALNPADRVKVLAETRGEGGYVVVAPSGGSVHRSGRPWEACEGSTFGEIPAIGWVDRNLLHQAVFEVLDEMPPAQEWQPRQQQVREPGELTPGDDFNIRGDWREILPDWTWVRPRGHWWELRHPTASAETSATLGHSNDGEERLFVFSTNTVFDQWKPYTKFAAWAQLHHNGNFSSAASDLRKRGYGSPRVSSPFSAASGPGSAKAPPADGVDEPTEAVDAGLDWDDVVTHLKELSDDTMARKSYSRAITAELAIVDESQSWQWRDLLCDAGGLGRREFDQILREARRQARRNGRIQRNPNAPILPAPSDPLAVIRELQDKMPSTDGIVHLKRWRDSWYEWTGKHWLECSEASVQNWLYSQTEDALYESGDELNRWAPDRAKVGNLSHALGTAVVYRDDNADADRYLACANGVFDLKRSVLLPHSPSRFNLYSLPFDYDPKAECPQWLQFLEQVLPGDAESQRTLQEWFGYIISGRTDLQKMLSMVGDKRSGKGTISRVLRRLIGEDVVAHPTLRTLSGDFGLEDLLGKTLAVMGDVRWEGRGTGGAVEALLGIIGEDAKTVHRKNRLSWHGQLDARFMLMSNDSPRFSDASLALSGRMIHIHFKESFYGREDPGLSERLYGEMAGILLWALEGLHRLNERGRFIEPESAQEIREEVEEIASPVRTFFSEHTETAEGESVDLKTLHSLYQEWCNSQGEGYQLPINLFGRAIRSGCRDMGIEIARVRSEDGKKTRYAIGVKLQDWVVPPPSWASGTPGGRTWT